MEQDNKSRKRRDDNMDDNKPQRDDEGENSNLPKFSFTWIYILIFLALVGLQLAKVFGEQRETTWVKFDEWAHQGHIERLLVINNEEAYIYIKKDSLGFGDHKDIKPD